MVKKPRKKKEIPWRRSKSSIEEKKKRMAKLTIYQKILMGPIQEFFSGNPELSKIFIEVHKYLMSFASTIYYETTEFALLYFAQTSVRNFVHITKKRGKVILWTGGKVLPGVEPIQKHPSWGTIKVKNIEQLPALKAALSMSFEHFLFTIVSGQSVAWDASVPEANGDF